jgi:hypothetical protein
MKIWSILAVVVLLAVCAVAASALPTFDGATGVVTLPTAKVAPQGDLTLAITSLPSAPSNWEYMFYRLNVGIAKDVELSASYQPSTDQDDGDNEDYITVGAKYCFLKQETSGVDVAIGGLLGKDTWGHDHHEAIDKAYLALSKDFMIDPDMALTARGTAGLLYGYAKWHGGDDSFTKPYVALELMNDSGLSLGAEYRWVDDDWDDDDALFSSVLRYQFPTVPLFVEVGTTNGEYLGLSWDNQRGFYGFGYAFDLDK